MVETATGIAKLRGDGIVHITIRNGAHQSLANAKENVAVLKELSNNLRHPLLIDMSGAKPLEPEVRLFYSDASLATWFSAMELVVEASALGRMMGKLYLRTARAGIPMQLFNNEPAALVWLSKPR